MSFSPIPFRCKVESIKICRVSGPDSEDFLQRLLTNDIKQIAEKEMQLSSWCNIKGRVSILVRVIRYQDYFMLLVDDFNLEKLFQALNKFVFNSNVTITNLSDNFRIYVGLNFKIGKDSNIIIKENHLNWEIEPTAEKSHDPRESDAYRDITPYAIYCINNLIPFLSENLCDKFLPQEINLEQLGGLSFNKGCFPGQEIIARVKYRGKLKKRLKKFISRNFYHGEDSFSHLTDVAGVQKGVIINAAKDKNSYLHILAVAGEELEDNLYLDKTIAIIPNG